MAWPFMCFSEADKALRAEKLGAGVQRLYKSCQYTYP